MENKPTPGDPTDAAWDVLKPRLSTDGWTVSDAFNYRGFFAWGWEARDQYESARWIPVSERLPECVPVLVAFTDDFGRSKVARACWAAKHTLEAGDFDGVADYDKAADEYYCPEGWYEWNEFEETHWLMNGVTHWMPLPTPPKDAP